MFLKRSMFVLAYHPVGDVDNPHVHVSGASLVAFHIHMAPVYLHNGSHCSKSYAETDTRYNTEVIKSLQKIPESQLISLFPG